MLAHLAVTTLILVARTPWVLPAGAGETNLTSPQNVEVHIVDGTFVLRWSGMNESVGNVTFSAEYQTPQMYNWIKLPGCQYVAGTECNFSSLKINVYEKMKLRVRAEEGDSTSPWCELDWFTPFKQAQIGPPKVHLEAEDKALIVTITSPGTETSGMWHLDVSNFVYSIVLWEKSSRVETVHEPVYSGTKIDKLSPETTYCLKVKARLRAQRRNTTYSTVYCVNTTVENKLPAPENVQVIPRTQDYVLRWDYTHENVTFRAQWLHAFLKRTPGSHAGRWTQIPSCEGVRTAWCVLPRRDFPRGTYFLRVQASDGNSTSQWSKEEEFNSERQIAVPTPSITLRALNSSSLRVDVSSQDRSGSPRVPLTHEIIFWEKASHTERKTVQGSTDVTFPNLKPLTMYCARARALVQDRRWNSSSNFSDATCAETKSGRAPRSWLVAALGVVLALPAVLSFVWILSRAVGYVFFPSSKVPPAIAQCFSEQPLSNLLLSTSEEETERCFIIEDTDTLIAVEDTDRADEAQKTYNSQTSQDSGNYSNEDESSGEALGPQEAL